MTEKLYYIDSHLFDFTARVLECKECKGGYAVILDRTAFFPEGGGQAADRGRIGSARVLYVQESDGQIEHICDAPLSVGQELSCSLERETRLRRMQNHSGEHVFSGLVHALFGFDNVGFHMGDKFMTIDFSGELDAQQLALVEGRANEAVRANLPVNTFFPPEEALPALSYRSKLDLTENVRIVEIEGIDRCACCAPHVSATGEIGLIKVLGFEKHRGGVRIELVCGMDALDEARIKQENVAAISRALSVKQAETAAAVDRLLSLQQTQKERCNALSLELSKMKAEAIEETPGNICVFAEQLDEPALRELVNMLMDKCGGIAAGFANGEDGGWRYIIGSRTVNLRSAAPALNAIIDGRGGGSPSMIQGRANADRETILSGISAFCV